MNKTEIKTTIQSELKKIEDEQILNEILNMICSYSIEKESLISDEQKTELDLRWEEYIKGEGETLNVHEVISEMKSRFSK